MGYAFLQLSPEQRQVAQRIARAAAEECAPDTCAIYPVLGTCIEDAVRKHWGGAIATFVPLLALRNVRCCIRSGTCDCGEC